MCPTVAYHGIDHPQMTAKALPFLDEDTRIVPILNNLSQGFLAGVSSEWSTATAGNGDEITADMIDDMAKKHFPACMRNSHECLRRDKHLKHFGRLQYGLFLKVSDAERFTGFASICRSTGPRALNRRGNHVLATIVQ